MSGSLTQQVEIPTHSMIFSFLNDGLELAQHCCIVKDFDPYNYSHH